MSRVPVTFEPMGSVKQRGGARSPRRSAAPRPVAVQSAAIGEFGRREIAERAVWADVVVVVLPGSQHCAGLRERGEQRLVQQLVAQPAVEALDEGVLRSACRARCSATRSGSPGTSAGSPCWSARCRCRRHTWPAAARGDDRLELARDPQARERGVGDQRQAFAGEVVDDRENAEAPAVGERIRQEVEAPALVRLPAGSPAAPWCQAPACVRRAGAPAAVPRDRAGGASCGS